MSKRILVVGGVAGGASFAARMRRLDESAQIVIFDKGDYVSFANCGLPYHIGNVIKDRDNLIIQTPEKFKDRFSIDVRLNSEVIAVNAAKKTVSVRHGSATYEESYDTLLLSPGCKPIRPPIKGINHESIYTLRNIPDMDRIKKKIDDNSVKSALVIGGGFIGLEMAENLRFRGCEVTLAEMADQVFIPADKEMAHLIHQHLTFNGVTLFLHDGASEFFDAPDGRVITVLKSGKRITAGMVILAIGVRPDTEFLKSSAVSLTEQGAIIVDNRMKSSLPDVYAVGDAVAVQDFISRKQILVPLAGPANRMGRIAADNVAGIASTYKDTQGTAICKIFDLTAAVTGLSEKNAKQWAISYQKSYIHAGSHAGYYPGAFPMTIKILFSPENGLLLGAQIVGSDGVDKRIDILATALRNKNTVYDLTELELAYAPSYGSAKDPVNMAGFVAENIMTKKMSVFHVEDLAQFDVATQQLLDVRTAEENEQGAIPGSLLIPLDSLRQRINELDKNKEIFVYCAIGLRGYLAARILVQQGFRVKNLSGGYKTWSHFQTQNFDQSYGQSKPQASCSSLAGDTSSEKRVLVDACGLQCPGPIAKLKKTIDQLKDGDIAEIHATDQGFAADIPSWCFRTRNTLVSLNNDKGTFKAVIKKGAPTDVCTLPSDTGRNKTMVIFSNDLDKMMAAFIIANGAASMGSEVSLFFTFWGLNLLRKKQPVKVNKDMIEKMFAMMMPRGSTRTSLSKMHMGGMGTRMMRMVMKKKKVESLESLIQMAQKSGVRFIACAMSMDIMGIKKEELIDGVEFGGVAYYLDKADSAAYNLFI